MTQNGESDGESLKKQLDDWNEKRERTVRTAITPLGMQSLLQLPEGVEVRSMYYDFESDCIMIRLQSSSFPKYIHPEGALMQDPFVLPMMRTIDGGTHRVPVIDWVFPQRED